MIKRWLLVVAIAAMTIVVAAGFAVASVAHREAATCGVERWSVKTLQDPAGRAINLTTVKKTTVNALRAKPVQRGPGGSRGSGVESTVYEVKARLVDAKVEEDDDIHLVIKGITTPGTMIIEFPTVACSSSATAGAKTRMKTARNAFVAACGMPGTSSFRHLTGRATIRGVGFFDFKHGQRGLAPNGIELHPVLKFTDATCQVVSPGPPPPPPPPPPSPTPPPPPATNCDSSYPTVCIPPPPPDLDCGDIPHRNFAVRPPDPHRFDSDKDGIGCET